MKCAYWSMWQPDSELEDIINLLLFLSFLALLLLLTLTIHFAIGAILLDRGLLGNYGMVSCIHIDAIEVVNR